MLCCKLGLQSGGTDLQRGWRGQTHGRAGCKGVLKGLQQHWSQPHSQQPLTDLYVSSIQILSGSLPQVCSVYSMHRNGNNLTYKDYITAC